MERRHYWFLDGLRGLAASSVVILHWLSGHQIGLFGASVLAVDFFFMLSGVVIQISYHNRIRDLADARTFAVRRIIRLYPLIVVSLAFGLLRFGVLAYRGETGLNSDPLQAQTVAAHFLMLPVDLSSIVGMFPLNAPLWSLHFEFVAYLLFAVVLAHASDWALATIPVLATPGLALWATHHFGHEPVTTIVPEYGFGLSRVCFAFTIGVLLGRLHLAGRLPRFVSKRNPRPVAVALPLAVFIVPASLMSPAVALAAIVVVFPAVIVFGLGVELSERAERLAKSSGDLSFPLYVLHVPIMWTLSGGLKAAGLFDDPVYNGMIVLPTILLASFVILKWVDEPIRSHLAGPRPLRPRDRTADLT